MDGANLLRSLIVDLPYTEQKNIEDQFINMTEEDKEQLIYSLQMTISI